MNENLTACFADKDNLNKKLQESTLIINQGNNCNSQVKSANE
jgi:hypothetical protein